MRGFIEHWYPGEPNEVWRIVVEAQTGKETTMDVKDIKCVLELAKSEHDDSRGDVLPADHEAMGKSIEAVETWLTEIGALPPR